MENYKDLNDDSGITGYEIGNTSIKALFKTGKSYTYSYNKAGKKHVENMKSIAMLGDGLNAYINKNVRKLYAYPKSW